MTEEISVRRKFNLTPSLLYAFTISLSLSLSRSPSFFFSSSFHAYFSLVVGGPYKTASIAAATC